MSSPVSSSSSGPEVLRVKNRRCVPLDFFARGRPWQFHQQAFSRGANKLPAQVVLPGDSCVFGLPISILQHGPFADRESTAASPSRSSSIPPLLSVTTTRTSSTNDSRARELAHPGGGAPSSPSRSALLSSAGASTLRNAVHDEDAASDITTSTRDTETSNRENQSPTARNGLADRLLPPEPSDNNSSGANTDAEEVPTAAAEQPDNATQPPETMHTFLICATAPASEVSAQILRRRQVGYGLMVVMQQLLVAVIVSGYDVGSFAATNNAVQALSGKNVGDASTSTTADRADSLLSQDRFRMFTLLGLLHCCFIVGVRTTTTAVGVSFGSALTVPARLARGALVLAVYRVGLCAFTILALGFGFVETLLDLAVLAFNVRLVVVDLPRIHPTLTQPAQLFLRKFATSS
ncbi:unnamed protein product [Amoebophrya sp. A25]|nr:unnamed protein product [Amoebophrya sp. A25]|eukprot:GSA25T00019954001.1